MVDPLVTTSHRWLLGGYAECKGSLSTVDTTGYSITRFPIVLERSARLNLDLDRVGNGDVGDMMTGRMVVRGTNFFFLKKFFWLIFGHHGGGG